MAEENTQDVEDTTTQAAVEETTETAAEDNIDYDQEFDTAVKKFEAREGFQQRKAAETSEDVDIDTKVAEAVAKLVPQLQSTLAEDTIETQIERLANGNPAKAKLIRFHFDNSVAPYGTLSDRLENALLIADKKTIFKTQKEMVVALNNRQGLSSTGQGTSTEGQQVQDSFFSPDQLADLKARGYDDTKIERLKVNLRNQK